MIRKHARATGVFLTIRFFLLPWPRWTIASVSCFMFPRDQVEERKDYERGAGERCKKKKHKPKDNNENLGTLSDVCFSWADVNVSRFFISFGSLSQPLTTLSETLTACHHFSSLPLPSEKKTGDC